MGVEACPYCKAPLQAGSKFCESCGRRLESTKAASAQGMDVPRPAAAADAKNCDHRNLQDVGPCPFRLSVALPPAMQVGRRSNVDIRFRAAGDFYESVEFVLRNGEKIVGRAQCCPGRPLAVEHEVSLAATPQISGEAKLALDVVCSIGTEGDTEIHTASLHVTVDDREATAFNPVFNITQHQTADRAGDTTGGDINVNLGGLQIQNQSDAARYDTSSSEFAPLATQLSSSPTRLTMRCAGEALQLVSDTCVTFGRNRDNTIPLRICGADGKVDLALNRLDCGYNLSRYHFRLESTASDCLIKDGGFPPGATDAAAAVPSAHGTRVDGTRLPPAGCLRLASGREVVLGVGREDVELKMRLRLFRDSWGRPSGVLLDREDGARQRVGVVWREVPLAAGVMIAWNGSYWALKDDSSAIFPLVVGTTVSIGGTPYDVLPFHPVDLI